MRSPEEVYVEQVNVDHRRKLGQYFTPKQVADIMARWIAGNGDAVTILDPAVGLGIFFRSLTGLCPGRRFALTGYDVDPGMLARVRNIFHEVPVSLIGSNYLTADWDARYDGIICNPPYVKFKSYEPKDELLRLFEDKLRIKLSGFSNLYTLFLLKALHQLAPGGRAAFIIPFEFMNADYGRPIKQALVENGMLKRVMVVDSQTGLFEDALTTSSILLFANDGRRDAVEFVAVENAADLEKPNVVRKVRVVDPAIKWRAYVQEERSRRYRNLVPFSKYGKVSRGIATGANEYFVFTESRRELHRIGERFLLPCVTKAAQVKGSFFTAEHFSKLLAEDKPVRILNAKAEDLADIDLREYIQFGEAGGYDQRFLTKKRNPWFIAEQRPPAPIWASTFNRGKIRFIRNEAGVCNLTAFHSVYLHEEAYLELMMAYLLTDVSREIFEDNRRDYGGGLRKFEPHDIQYALVADVEQLPASVQEEVLASYRAYRSSGATEHLTRLNSLFLGFMTK